MAQFYGLCLALLLFHRLIEKYVAEKDWEICWQKAIHSLRRRCSQLIQIVKRNFWGIQKFLRTLDKDFRRFARKETRRKSLTIYVLLQAIHA